MTGAREECTSSLRQGSTLPLPQCLPLSERGSHLCLLGTHSVSRGEGCDGGIRADCLEEEANGQHLAGWGHCPWRRQGGQWTAGSGEGGLDAHCHLCADTQRRNASRSKCKDGVTHPVGTAHRQGGVLQRSSERQPQTHRQL